MNFSIRRKLDMAGRVRDFCRTHPDQNNPGYTAAVQRLEERVVRAEALAQQEISGRQSVSGAVINKEQLRLEVHKAIALLAGLAEPAAREERELAVGIIRPDVNGSHQAFLTRSRVAAATASSHQELLVRYGLPEKFLEELDAKLNEYEQALNQQHAGRAAHVGARAELEAVTSDVMLIVRQVDALNRFRYRSDPESLAAWKSARDVAWPLPSEKDGPAVGNAVKPAA
ncbi:MAG: hypothetical protein ACJ8AM_09335 [Gemmatimonadales bacterium]